MAAGIRNIVRDPDTQRRIGEILSEVAAEYGADEIEGITVIVTKRDSTVVTRFAWEDRLRHVGGMASAIHNMLVKRGDDG